MKQPFMPLFFGDLLASTQTWEGEERALYIVLLACQWSAGPLPTDPRRIAKMAQYDPDTFAKLWEMVSTKFIQSADGLINARLEQHRDRASEISEKRAAAGAKGGQSKKQKDSKFEAIAKDLPSHPNQTKPNQSIPILDRKNTASASPPVVEVFEHWKSVHKHPSARLDARRQKLIAAALSSYSVADLCQSISGYLNSPHHMGQNERATVYDDIELMLRDAKHIDAGLKFSSSPPRTELSSLTRKNVASTADWVPPEMRNAAV